MFKPIQIVSSFMPDERAVVYPGDCRELLRQMPPKTIQVVVTSPPCNLGKEYESWLHLNDCLAKQREVITDCVRVLSEGGSICWQVGNCVDSGAMIPRDSLFYPIFADLGVKMWNRIIWHFEHGLHWRN